MLSTMSGTPWRFVTSAIASRSSTMPPGLASPSQKTNLTLSVIAFSTFSGSVMSTKWQCQPSFLKLTPNWVTEPP